MSKLEPPDYKRCQAEKKEGSFMTLGPRYISRCKNKPVVVLVERKKDKDGLQGSMSLCQECFDIFKKVDNRKVTIQRIG